MRTFFKRSFLSITALFFACNNPLETRDVFSPKDYGISKSHNISSEKNDIYFHINRNFEDLKFELFNSFNEKVLDLSSKVKNTETSTDICLTLNTKQKLEVEDADWFRKKAINRPAIGNKSISWSPEQLGFAFEGRFLFKYKGQSYVSDEVVLGQGKNLFYNNWWIGGYATDRYGVGFDSFLVLRAYYYTRSGMITNQCLSLKVKAKSYKLGSNHFSVRVLDAY